MKFISYLAGAVFTVALCSGCGDPKLDTSSAEAFAKSLKKVEKTVGIADLERFQAYIWDYAIGWSTLLYYKERYHNIDDLEKNLLDHLIRNFDSYSEGENFQSLNGLTAKKIIAIVEAKEQSSFKTAIVLEVLQQIALFQFAVNASPELAESYVYTQAPFGSAVGTNITSAEQAIEQLAALGFRPDPNVAFAIIPVKGTAETGFIAFAARSDEGMPLFFYDSNNESVSVNLYDSDYSPANVPLHLNTYTYDPQTERVTAGPPRAFSVPTGIGLDNAAKIK